jgi:DNA-binding response OmpR family regulator
MENTKSILLVEDDPFLIDIYTTKLKESGFAVETADSGEEVLNKTKEKKFDLVILDIVLPQVDGWEIIGKIKSDPESKDLKVIILSNLGQKEEVEKGMKLGAEKYLIKAHYTPSQVVEEIKKIIH